MLIEQFTDDYVLEEIKKIKYTYGVNSVIRYNLEREELHKTQSVAEHVTNMLFLAYYFKELEDPKSKLDFDKVVRMILMHDMAEIETGDIITTIKTAADNEVERLAVKTVKEKSPEFVAREVEELYDEIEESKTFEAQFVKAIDKLEGQIFWIEKEGVEMVDFIDKKTGIDINVVYPIMMDKINKMLSYFNFKYIQRFMDVIHQERMKTGILKY
ncbi:MAG: HD domain-containing protein [Patescibacteria group bacterium]